MRIELCGERGDMVNEKNMELSDNDREGMMEVPEEKKKL